MNTAPILKCLCLVAATGHAFAETPPAAKSLSQTDFLKIIGLEQKHINQRTPLPALPPPVSRVPLKPATSPAPQPVQVRINPQITEPPLPDNQAVAADVSGGALVPPAPAPPTTSPDGDVSAAMKDAKALLNPGDPLPVTPPASPGTPAPASPSTPTPLITEPAPDFMPNADLVPEIYSGGQTAPTRRPATVLKIDPELTKQRVDREGEAKRLAMAAEKRISAKTISLVDAVRLTLEANPMIKLGVLDAEQAENTLQQIQGAFDHRVSAQYDWRYQRTESKDKEKDKERARYAVTRELYKTSGIILDRINKVATGQLSPDDYDYSGTAFEDSNAVLNNPPDAEPEDQAIFEQELLRDENIKAIRRAVSNSIPQTEVDQINDLAVQAVVAQKKAFTLLRQQSYKGLIRNPPWITRRVETQKYELALIRKFRSGPEAKLYAKVNSQEDNLSTRGKDPRENRSAVGIQLSVNLAKMGLADLDYASEKAQLQQLDAARELARTKVAEEVLNTALAYWQVAAAQEKLERLYLAELETLASTTLAKNLIGAEILPAAELSQVNARQLQAVAARYGAEIELATAQQSLAVSMGFDPLRIDLAPFAADELPSTVDQQALEALAAGPLIRHTLQFHPNLVAYRYLDNSNLILSEQARRDLRPDFDLTMGGEFTGYNQETGLDGAFGVWGSHTIGPSVFLGGRLDWPLENRGREGAYAGAINKLESNRVQEDNVRRRLASQVALSHQRLRISASQLTKLQSATEEAGKALSIERQKLRNGSGTATDVLTAEQNLTQFSVQEIGARLQNATSLAELRYSTFTILPPFSYDRMVNGGNLTVTRDNFTELPSPLTLNRYHMQPSIFTATQPVTSMERFGFGKPQPLLSRLTGSGPPRSVTYTGSQGQKVTAVIETTAPPEAPAPRLAPASTPVAPVRSTPAVVRPKPAPAAPALAPTSPSGKPKPLFKRLLGR